MPLPFKPRFVDLVRTYCSSAGTGPLVPGGAVPGFSSFADTLRPGDQFYYCVQSTSRPAEREVGRGTLQGDGTIAREPLVGPPVSLGGGSKTIALVTASEWFRQVCDVLETTASRTRDVGALARHPVEEGAAVVVTEPGRGGLFVFRGEDESDLIAADPRQAIAIAPVVDPSGRSGAWVRQYDGRLDVRWFGAKLDNQADDGPAFAAAIALSKTLAVNASPSDFYRAGPSVLVPAATAAFLGTTTLDIAHTLTLEGQSGSGQQGAAYASELRWAPGVTGIRIQRADTSGAGTVDTIMHQGGDCSVIRGLRLRGGFTGTEGEDHGIHVKARCVLENLYLDNWAGDGVRIHADAASTGPDHGNANNGIINTVTVLRCRDGVSISGGDANAWTIRDLDTSHNRRWGRFDNAFLCNTYIGGHASDNGLVKGAPASVVSHGGQRYAVVAGQEAVASVTAPAGTIDTATWLYLSPGGPDVENNIPAWTNSIALRAGGAARFSNPNSDKLVLGFYTESGQGPVQASHPTLIIGGTQGAGVRGAPVLRNRFGVITAEAIGSFQQSGTLGTNLRPGMLEFTHPSNGNQSLQWFGNDLAFTTNNSGISANWALKITSEGTTASIGRRRVDFPNGFGLGDKKRLPGTAPPSSGTFVQGDVVENIAPTPGGPVQWVCTSGGAPGTWVAIHGTTSSGPAIGYSAGAGGQVMQSPDKSAGVTLHKACGQITLAASSLAAGGVISFALANNVIAAGDIVSVSVAGGASAGAYAPVVDQILAGSCRISIRNLSGAALAEAIVLNFAVLKGANA